jgi:hypothetical protein
MSETLVYVMLAWFQPEKKTFELVISQQLPNETKSVK